MKKHTRMQRLKNTGEFHSTRIELHKNLMIRFNVRSKYKISFRIRRESFQFFMISIEYYFRVFE